MIEARSDGVVSQLKANIKIQINAACRKSVEVVDRQTGTKEPLLFSHDRKPICWSGVPAEGPRENPDQKGPRENPYQCSLPQICPSCGPTDRRNGYHTILP